MKRTATVLLAAAAILAVASPAGARPVLDEPRYHPPGYGMAAYFAGIHATGCGDSYKVYGEPKKRCR